MDFIKVPLLELIKRIPSNLNVFQQIRNFSTTIILNSVQRSTFLELPFTFVSPYKLTDIEIQYRNLLNIDRKEMFGESVADNSIILWKEVINIKNAAHELMFKEMHLLF